MSQPTRMIRWLPGVGAAVTVMVLLAAGWLLFGVGGGNVNNPDVEFSTTPTPTATQPRAPTPAGARHDPSFEWPHDGYTKDRTRVFELRDPAALHPPYEQRWARRGSILLEFAPVLGKRSLYLLKNNGALHCISRRTGKILWRRKLGSLAASSPAYAHNTVFVVLLNRFKGSKGGRIAALNASNGRTRWSRKLPTRAESSPLVDRGRVYFGSEDGTVYKLRVKNGSVVWRYRADGAVKGGIAMDQDHNLYFGDYAGKVHSVRAKDGSKRWESSTKNGRLGLVAGRFYSTPAVAYERVFLGSTDGFVYSFGARTGRLGWRHHTGGYVYSSPAVGQLPGLGPTVWIGSYDSKLYALDAQSGRPRWIKKAEGRISGGVVAIGDLVFYSTLAKTTTAVGARTGKTLWRTRRGAFNPTVTDGRRIYLVGYSSLFALTPKRLLAGAKPRKAKPRKAKPKTSKRTRRSARVRSKKRKRPGGS